ncbi:MAG: hypothetical protein HQ523_13780 [Lentisphaerae bacterium]|nr:hypothetical protein [Lentisphaerota bacterium]
MNTTRQRSATIYTAAAILLVAAMARASYPAAPLPARPTPLPALPAGFSPCTPPVSENAPNSDAPALAEWTRSNEPGDTLALTGSRLTAFSGDEAGRDSQFIVFGQTATDAVTADADIQRISGQQVAISLPSSLPTPALYMVWPKNEHGFGAPALLNQTEAWWIGPDTVTRQETVSVFGRNLTAGDEGTTSWIYLQAADDSGLWLPSSAANPYKADFTIPANTGSGSYRVWVHNSLGGQYGWSGPLSLTVDNGVSWTGPEIDVTAYGATGDGITDDYAAIDAAIHAAKGIPGSTLIFPQGTYLVSHTIDGIPDHTRLRGAGMDLTTIAAHPGFTTDGFGLLFGSMEKVAFEDLTFDTKGRVSGVLGNNVAYIRDSSRVQFTNVRFQQVEAGSFTTIVDVHHCRLITFRGCDFIVANGLFLGAAEQVFIEGCDFRGIHDNNALIVDRGGHDISIVGCTAADYDASDPTDGSGWCQGRFVAGFGAWGAMRNHYFGGNRTTDLTVRPGFDDQNTGEHFMYEALDTLYRGTAVAAGASTVQLAGLTSDCIDTILVIVDGTGMGQSRAVNDFDASTSTVTVDEPWRVRPATDSIIMIGNYMSRMAVYDNSFDGKERAVTNETHIAAAGVEPYGGCVDLVVARNRFHQLRIGISNWSLALDTAANGSLNLQPNYFNLFTDNEFEHCRSGIGSRAASWSSTPEIDDVGILGNVYRANHMSDLIETAFSSESWIDGSAVDMCVYDQNTATNVGMAFWCETSGIQNHILVGNHFESPDGAELAMVLQPDHRPALRGNVWEGFAADSGVAPGAILELPQRTLSLSCALGQDKEGTIQVWNSGTTPLGWQATTSSEWLEILTPNGTILDQRCSGALVMKADTAGLQPGRYLATVTIGSAGQTRQITVELIAGLSGDAPPPLIAFDSPEATSTGQGVVQWLNEYGVSTNSASDLDSDGDGMTLLEEYAYNMDPTVASREDAPRLQAGPTPGTIHYEFNRARAELTYKVERCTDLRSGNWTTVATNPGTVGTRVSLAVTPEPQSSCGFFRLAILYP